MVCIDIQNQNMNPVMLGPGSQSLTSFGTFKQQHSHNLQSLLHACLDKADMQTGAAVAAVLLDAQNLGIGHGLVRESKMDYIDHDFDDLLQVCTELLKQEPLSADQLRSCLRKMIQAHASVHAIELARMVLALLLIEQGEMDQALLALEIMQLPGSATLQRGALQLFTRHALTALIKHHQLLGLLNDSAAATSRPGPAQQQAASQSRFAPANAPASQFSQPSFLQDGGGRREPAAPGSVRELVFAYDSRLWLRASSSRQVKEVWKECEKRLKEALALHPAAILLSYALVHIYIVSGKFTQALPAARAACIASPEDLDAVILHHLVSQVCLEHQDAQQGGAHESNAGHEAAPGLVRVLELDGTSQAALTGLLSSCAHCPACMMRAAQGCLRYLDMQPSGLPLPFASLAWRCLAASLCGMAEQMMKAAEDGLEGPSGAEPESNPRAPPTWPSWNDSTLGSTDDILFDSEAGPRTAHARWRLIEAELDSRAYWWEQAHFAASEGSGRGGALETARAPGQADPMMGTTSPEGVSCFGAELASGLCQQAAVCCFMLGHTHAFVSCSKEVAEASLAYLRHASLSSGDDVAMRDTMTVSGSSAAFIPFPVVSALELGGLLNATDMLQRARGLTQHAVA